MANYYATARTNYFAVKDADAFKAEVSKFGCEVIEREHETEGIIYGLLDSSGQGFNDVYWDENDEDIQIDWADIFKRHLKDEWVAVMMEVGAEKYRYLNGFAWAYNNKGEERRVMLDNIYDLALELGSEVSLVSY